MKFILLGLAIIFFGAVVALTELEYIVRYTSVISPIGIGAFIAFIGLCVSIFGCFKKGPVKEEPPDSQGWK
jgi:hypothetical protein